MPSPLYQQIYEEIQSSIETGEYVEDQMLPTEKELIEKYGVSRITVRRAIEDLCADGYLIKRQGKGTFVAPPHMSRAFLQSNLVQSFTDLCASVSVKPGAHVISREIVPAREQEREFLGLPEGAYFCISNVSVPPMIWLFLKRIFFDPMRDLQSSSRQI